MVLRHQKYDFAKDLRGRLAPIILRSTKDISNSQWIERYTAHPYDLTKKFSFAKHQYFLEIVNSFEKHIVVKKAAQVGMTETQVRFVFPYLARHPRHTIIYTMPTATDVMQFSKTRFDPIVEGIREFGVVDQIDSATLKRILGGFLYFRGTMGSRSAISIPADMLIHDEYDFSDMTIISQYQSRLESSDIGYTRLFSTPTYNGVGIDKKFTEGSQAYYMYKCEHCGNWNHFDYRDFINTNIFPFTAIRESFVCYKCGQKLLKALCKSEWVHKYPKRKKKSYLLTKTSLPYDLKTGEPQEVRHIIDSCENYLTKQDAYNFGLGETFDSADKPFPRKVFDNAFIKDNIYGGKVSMGIDTGKPVYVMVMTELYGQKYILYWNKFDVDNARFHIKKLIKLWGPNQIAIDMPDYSMIVDVRRMFPNTFQANFRTTAKLLNKDNSQKSITLNRDGVISMLSTAFAKEEIKIVGDYDDLLVDHFTSVINEDNKYDFAATDHHCDYVSAMICAYLYYLEQNTTNVSTFLGSVKSF